MAMTTVEEWLAHYNRHDVTDLESACVAVGRNNAPLLLAELWAEGHFTWNPEQLTSCIGAVWSMSEYPDRYLEHETWRELFALAGYTVDGDGAPRPAEAIRLWRGSVPERRGDWSWTDSRAVAERYAAGTHYGRPKSMVWTAMVEPRRLLARNTERDESEYVVDTEGLAIELEVSQIFADADDV